MAKITFAILDFREPPGDINPTQINDTFDSAGGNEIDSAGEITGENDENALRQCRIQIFKDIIVATSINRIMIEIVDIRYPNQGRSHVVLL